jgi:hypothetical protein
MSRKAVVHDGEDLQAFDPAGRSPELRVVYTLRQDAPGSAWRAAVSWQVRTEAGRWREAFRDGEQVRRGTAVMVFSAWFRSAYRIHMRFVDVATEDVVSLARWEASARSGSAAP